MQYLHVHGLYSMVCIIFCLKCHHINFQLPVKPTVFMTEAKATDPVLGGGSLSVRPEGGASVSSTPDSNTSLPQNTQRARATGEWSEEWTKICEL